MRSFTGRFIQPFLRTTNRQAVSSGQINLLGERDHCLLNGMAYRFDRSSDDFKAGAQTIALLRNQIDASNDPGEQSINREELWRRSKENWYKGAGQRFADKPDSDPDRFYSSKGIDPWTRWQLSLLHDTMIANRLQANNLHGITVSDWYYVTSETTVLRTQNPAGAYQATQRPDQSVLTSIATDGYTLWATANGTVQRTNRDTNVWTNWLSAPTGGNYYLVGYVRGRLLAADRQWLYEVSNAPAATNLHPSFGNTDWRWTALAESVSHIYAGGYSGNHSQIWRVDPTNNDPAVVLGAPVPAAPALPAGERIQALLGYLGYLIIGTDRGLRVATINSSGDLSIGALIEVPGGVTAFEGAGRFVWFTWSNYDDQTTGLGRLDLSVFPEENAQAPAYASDLMVAGQGQVTSIATYNDKRIFTVANLGVVVETDNCVSQGTIDQGQISYGMIDPKVAMRVDVRQESTTGQVGVTLSADDGATTNLGLQQLGGSVTKSVSFDAHQLSASNFTLRTTLYRSDTTPTVSPVVKQIQLRSWPSPRRGFKLRAPLLLTESNERHPSEDFDTLMELVNSNRTATYQEMEKTWNVIVEDWTWMRVNETADRRWWNGTFTLELKVVAL